MASPPAVHAVRGALLGGPSVLGILGPVNGRCQPRDVTRIYYDLDDELHRAAKLSAVTKGITLKAWLIEAITEKLERDEADKPRGGR
jgi:hypothetical protein